jgi:flagellar biosynthesis protein FlhF
MEIKSFRASTLRRALQQVQKELGPEASVLRTREVWDGWLGGLMGKRRVEVFASRENSPSAAEDLPTTAELDLSELEVPSAVTLPFPPMDDFSAVAPAPAIDVNAGETSAQFELFTQLLDAEWSEPAARRVLSEATAQAGEEADVLQLRDAVHRTISDVVRVQGPIQLPAGQRKVVALVGPTGVGKTTTIAKLAANFRLRENKKVALVTVDTYRVAAVEQLRTYADIIDLPMHVVATPREMKAALEQLADFDLVLLDTAGRSPHDEIRIQELQGILGAAEADEVHLVLSTTTGARALQRTAEKFGEVGVTSLLLTKLDESVGLGEVLPLLEQCDLPISYVTNGQSVPDDIQDARLADLPNAIMGLRQAA